MQGRRQSDFAELEPRADPDQSVHGNANGKINGDAEVDSKALMLQNRGKVRD